MPRAACVLDPVFFRPELRTISRLLEPVTARELSGFAEETSVVCKRDSGSAGCECSANAYEYGFNTEEGSQEQSPEIPLLALCRFFGVRCKPIKTHRKQYTNIFSHEYVSSGSGLPHNIYGVLVASMSDLETQQLHDSCELHNFVHGGPSKRTPSEADSDNLFFPTPFGNFEEGHSSLSLSLSLSLSIPADLPPASAANQQAVPGTFTFAAAIVRSLPLQVGSHFTIQIVSSAGFNGCHSKESGPRSSLWTKRGMNAEPARRPCGDAGGLHSSSDWNGAGFKK
ncbi:hypothetical protein BDP55DRAFT_752585 [Colletotrichum godetiae]|uniref:Uncharacterized protein n=1 Tax=Colletotrichum godetiae TaxID=1209918 RepID=A0AAJ0AH57_9PEZI|nr:uncharacterized protein BDP55DRAFT_752585 [Colletotrichum godetiae]KAK1671626.1 hypothetical protein BDP55DRAFT_752585 [Colletotrichum godetiae]